MWKDVHRHLSYTFPSYFIFCNQIYNNLSHNIKHVKHALFLMIAHRRCSDLGSKALNDEDCQVVSISQSQAQTSRRNYEASGLGYLVLREE